jgi:hypothetical protein
MIDGDLMVSINHTYDKDIHDTYQIKRLHSAVQNIRKKIGLRPWNKITVVVDDRYANTQIVNLLSRLLTNTSVIMSNFYNDTTYGALNGIHETAVHIVYGDTFMWECFKESVSGNQSVTLPADLTSGESSTLSEESIVGRLMVHYFKNG